MQRADVFSVRREQRPRLLEGFFERGRTRALRDGLHRERCEVRRERRELRLVRPAVVPLGVLPLRRPVELHAHAVRRAIASDALGGFEDVDHPPRPERLVPPRPRARPDEVVRAVREQRRLRERREERAALGADISRRRVLLDLRPLHRRRCPPSLRIGFPSSARPIRARPTRATRTRANRRLLPELRAARRVRAPAPRRVLPATPPRSRLGIQTNFFSRTLSSRSAANIALSLRNPPRWNSTDHQHELWNYSLRCQVVDPTV
eukprot:30986-Pelagococcus_subviridis.AAC.13